MVVNEASFLSTPDILLVFLAVLILFGAPKLPEFARSLGKSIRIFKDEANTLRSELETASAPIKEVTKLPEAELSKPVEVQKPLNTEQKVELNKKS